MRATLALLRGAGAAALAACALAFALPAQAGIFDDDEARRAILDLRKQLEQSNEQARARQAEQMAVMNDSIGQLKRSLLDLNSQIETQRADNARLRGQIEELARSVAELQRKQTDIQQGVDDRIRKIEPQKVTVDGREFTVDPEEKRQYDDALAGFRRGEFDRAAGGFAALHEALPGERLPRLGAVLAGQRAVRACASTRRRSPPSAPSSPPSPRAARARPRRCWPSPTARPS